MDFAARRLAPKRAELTALLDQIAPGGCVVKRRRLPGGLGCRMDVLDIRRADGSRGKVTLRRFVREGHRFSTPGHVAHEFEILRLVERAAVPAPRPILLDSEGHYFGVPAIVMSYLPGRPLFPTTNLGNWTRGLADDLRQLHNVRPQRFDLSLLHVQLRDGMRARIEQWRTEPLVDPLAVDMLSVLDSELHQIDFSGPTIVHDDFWSGNTVASRGRITGIIDWTTAEVGDPRTDVSQCRIDMVLSHGPEVADRFRDDYERLAGKRLEHLWYFDLYRGYHAWPQYEHWLEGYHDIGLVHLRPTEVGERLRAFLHRAVGEARTSQSTGSG